MIINRIHITAFGPLKNFDCELYSGLNLIKGENESGKTSLAMFIKFIFYGLSGRGSDSAPSERKKYVNWDTGTAEGYLIAAENGREYRIERTLTVSSTASGRESVRESISVTDNATGERISELEECPGAVMFGVPEQIFVNTVFAGQSGGSRIDGANTAVAVENLLFSADETVSVKKAAELIDKRRRTLLHKNGGGGEIAALKDKCADLKNRLDKASVHAAELIELENAAELQAKAEANLKEAIEWQNKALRYFDAECLNRDGENAKAADGAAAAAEVELRSALSVCCEPSKLDDARRLAASIEGERASAAEFEEKLHELELSAASLADPNAPADPEGELKIFNKSEKAARGLTVAATVIIILGFIIGGMASMMYVAKSQHFLGFLAGAALLFILSGIFFIIRGRNVAVMKRICAMFNAEDEEKLKVAVKYALIRKAEAENIARKTETVKLSLEQSAERSEAFEIEANTVSASFESCCMADEHPADEADALTRLRGAISLADKRVSEAEAARAAYETALAIAAEKWSRIKKDKLAEASAYLRDTPKDEKYPADTAGADKLRQELSFNQAKMDALQKKLHTIEVELAGKRAVSDSPAGIFEELETERERLRKLTLEHEATVLAAETLNDAGENMRRGIIPRIVKRASELFTTATEGRYESLGSGSTFALSAVKDGHTRSAALLSSGTEDLAYVCLRIALASELFGDKKPPLVFDETLAHMDPGRIEAVKDTLAMCGHQSLVFACNATDPTLRMQRQ